MDIFHIYLRMSIEFIVYSDTEPFLYVHELLVEVLRLFKRGVYILLLLIFMLPEVKPEVLLPVRYLFYNVIFKPFYTLSFFPKAILKSCVCCFVDSETVLLASHPVSEVQTAISPFVDAVSVLFIVFILTHVASSIGPRVYPHAVQVVV